MQLVQKIYIECQEMMPEMKIKTGHFWFQNKKYLIKDGNIVEDEKPTTVGNKLEECVDTALKNFL